MQPGWLPVAARYSAANPVQRKLVACSATAMTIPVRILIVLPPEDHAFIVACHKILEVEALIDLSLRQVAVKPAIRKSGWIRIGPDKRLALRNVLKPPLRVLGGMPRIRALSSIEFSNQ
jgi:hypothetical protein